jgi:hypothetical protein
MALAQRGDETITVSTTAIGFTAAEIQPTKSTVFQAVVHIESGGPLRFNSSQDPTAAGSEGSQLIYAGSKLTVFGNLPMFKMIAATGMPDATVRVAYFGSGA